MTKKVKVNIALTIFITLSIYIMSIFTYTYKMSIITVLLPIIRGLIIFDIINMVKKPEKGTRHIEYIMSIIVELLFILLQCREENIFFYIAVIVIVIKIFIRLFEKEATNNNKNKYTNITRIITLLLFFLAIIIEFFDYEFIPIISIFLLAFLEELVRYDITKVVNSPDRIMNYINIAVFNLFILMAINLSSMRFASITTIIIMLTIIIRVFVILICKKIKKKPTTKHKITKIIIGIISCIVIFIIIKSIIVIKIPYDVYYNTVLSPKKLMVINNEKEFNELFNEDIINEQVQELEILQAQGKLKEKKDLIQELKETSKQNLIEEFGIDDKFFDEYYLVFFADASGNTAVPMGIDYITYNKINKKVKFVQKDTIIRGFGVDDYSYCSYFVKIDKKYFGEVGWKTEYVLFSTK